MTTQRGGEFKVQNPTVAAEERFDRRHEELAVAFGNMNLEEQMTHFISRVTMNEDEIWLRQKVMDDLGRVVAHCYPEVVLHPFGSLISGLGDKDSDLDVFVDCIGGAMNGGRSIDKEVKTELFQTVVRILRKYQYGRHALFHSVVPIASARIPIIKFIHRETGIHCDVSFENILSIRNSQLIQFMVQLDPRVRPLMCLLRYWGKFHKITDSTKIKNYGLILLVLVFLKRKGILPSVYKLQHWTPAPPEFRVDCWNASFYSNKTEILKFLDSQGRPAVELNEFGQPTTISILQLALEFFQFYANFQPDVYIVCTLTGKFINRDLFVEGFEQELPEELADYKAFSSEYDSEIRRLDTSARMSFIIQDPFALNFNVSAVTRENILIHFLKTCKATASHLSDFLDSSGDDQVTQNLMDIFSSVEFVNVTAQKRKEKRIVDQQQVIGYLNQLEEVKKNGQTPPPTLNFTKAVVDFVDAHLAKEQRQTPKATYEEVSKNYDHETAGIAKRLLAPLHEMEFTLSPRPAYKALFSERFSDVPGMKSSDVRRKGKILWYSFMQDFFKCFFSKCFGLTVEIEVKEPPVPEEKGAGVPIMGTLENNNNLEAIPSADAEVKEVQGYPNPFLATVPLSKFKPAHDYPNPFTATVPISKGSKRQRASTPNSEPESPSPTGRSLPPQAKYFKGSENGGSEGRRSTESPLSSPTREKLLTISDEVYKPLLLILRCEGKNTVWEGRKVTLKSIRKEGGIQTTSKPTDPMDIEEEITKRFHGNPAPFRFDCQVDFRPSAKSLKLHVGVKEVLFSLRKPSTGLAAISTMTTILQEMHEKYITYRLATWLEGKPSTIREKPKAAAVAVPRPQVDPKLTRPDFAQQVLPSVQIPLRIHQLPPPSYQMF